MKKRLLLFVALFLSLMIVQHQEIHAASTKEHGIVQKVEGEATYQSGASFNKTPLSISQKWESGDLIRTKKAASVEVNMQGTGDTFYIGENAEVYFTTKGKNIYVHVLKGNIFVAAEKRESETEALYIVSGKQTYKVLGTHFVVGIDPITDLPLLYVHSGIVKSENGSQSDSIIFPGHSYDPTNDAFPPIDLSEYMTRADSDVIRALLSNLDKIREENDQHVEDISRRLGEIPPFYDGTDESLDRFRTNLDALAVMIMKAAIDNGTVNEEDMRQIIDEINKRGGSQIDFDNPPRYEPEYSDEQRKAKEEAERRREALEKQRQEERQRQQEQKNRNQELMDRMEQERNNRERQQEEARKKAEEEARKRLEEQRRPAPTPPPRPTPPKEPEYEKLFASVETEAFTIDVYWETREEYHEYRLYLNGNLVDTIEGENYHYEFGDLRPNHSYDLKIEALDEQGNIIAAYEQFGIKTDYERLEFSIEQNDSHVCIELEDYQYEFWINEERFDGMIPFNDIDKCFILDAALFMKGENNLEIYKVSEGEKVGYGQTTVNIEYDWNIEDRFVFLRTNPTSAYIYWNPPIDDKEGLTLEVYKTQVDDPNEDDPDEGKPIIKIEEYRPFIEIDGLNSNTWYKIVEKENAEFNDNAIEFVTWADVWIDYSGDTISWEIPEVYNKEDITFDVYVNGEIMSKKKGRTKYESGELLVDETNPLQKFWEVKVDLFEKGKWQQSYKSTFINLAPIPD